MSSVTNYSVVVKVTSSHISCPLVKIASRNMHYVLITRQQSGKEALKTNSNSKSSGLRLEASNCGWKKLFSCMLPYSEDYLIIGMIGFSRIILMCVVFLKQYNMNKGLWYIIQTVALCKDPLKEARLLMKLTSYWQHKQSKTSVAFQSLKPKLASVINKVKVYTKRPGSTKPQTYAKCSYKITHQMSLLNRVQ